MTTKPELRSVYDRVVLDSLGPLSLGLAVVFTVFVFMGFVEAHPQPAFNVIVGSDLASAMMYFLLYYFIKHGQVPQRWANAVGFAGGILAVCNASLAYVMLRDPFYLTYLPMIMVAYGAFMLSAGWLALSLGVVFLFGLGVTWPVLPNATIVHYAPTWFAASLLAVALLVVRRRGVLAAQLALGTAQKESAERQRLETRLAQSQRLESVGRLVSGVAHDFNNLLTPVIGFAGMALQRTTEDEQLRFDLSEILRAGESAAALTAKLLAFSSQQVLQTRIIEINDVIMSAEGLMNRAVKENVRLVIELGPGAGRVRVDPIQMEQVLLNLAVNAGDAMPHGGHLLVETAPVNIADTASGAPRGPCVELCITDTGIGMNAEVREHIFEPFFTTKPPGHGTGLGLATVYGIIAQSGGSIEVDSEPGAGARFRILLPRIEAPADQNIETQPATTDNNAETVLLVEDDPLVRRVIAASLSSNGYCVLEASCAAEALDIAGREPFELLVTDVIMRKTNGVELAYELRRRGHNIAMVFMSGYAPEEVLRNCGQLPQSQFVSKPFRREALLRAAHRALADHRKANLS